MSIEDMAKAHLSSVQKAIIDLQTQKDNVENEIVKLTEYLKVGLQELESNTKDTPVVKE